MTNLLVSNKWASEFAEPTLFCRVRFPAFKRALVTLFWQIGLTLLAVGAMCPPRILAEALPEFAYRAINVQCVQADGRPVSNACIYGFCRELNVIWPRKDREALGR